MNYNTYLGRQSEEERTKGWAAELGVWISDARITCQYTGSMRRLVFSSCEPGAILPRSPKGASRILAMKRGLAGRAAAAALPQCRRRRGYGDLQRFCLSEDIAMPVRTGECPSQACVATYRHHIAPGSSGTGRPCSAISPYGSECICQTGVIIYVRRGHEASSFEKSSRSRRSYDDNQPHRSSPTSIYSPAENPFTVRLMTGRLYSAFEALLTMTKRLASATIDCLQLLDLLVRISEPSFVY